MKVSSSESESVSSLLWIGVVSTLMSLSFTDEDLGSKSVLFISFVSFDPASVFHVLVTTAVFAFVAAPVFFLASQASRLFLSLRLVEGEFLFAARGFSALDSTSGNSRLFRY